MKVAVGSSNHPEAEVAAQIAVASAHKTITQPDLVLAFCSNSVNPESYYNAIRAQLGGMVPIVGGSAIGVITNEFLGYQGATSALAFIQCDTIAFQLAHANGLFKDPEQTGKALAHSLKDVADASLLFVLYDSIKYAATSSTPALLNPSSLLLNGLNHSIRQSLPIVGAGLLGDQQFKAVTHFNGHAVSTQSASALLFSGAIKPYITVMHGCTPLSLKQYTITDIFGQFLYKLDGQPVVDVIDQAYGSPLWRLQSPVRKICLGRALASVNLASDEASYTNRLISGILPDNDGIILFEPDFKVGDKVQLMQRAPKQIVQSARSQTADLLQQIEQAGDKPMFALYINCGGRAAAFEDSDQEEAAEVQHLLNHAGIPLLGFYCGVEIAPNVDGKSQGLDWSGVLVIFSQ